MYGVLKATVSGMDNDTQRIDTVRLGPSSGIDAGTSGTEYFDAFESRRQSYIGPASMVTLTTATITSTMVTTYTYDAANRLTKVGTTNYTWDNNGNLINDGSAAYLYDRANRLISTTLSGVTTQFNYNGDGARLKQIVNGVVTTYTQDLAAPLPMVLQAKTGVTTTKYLYSLGTRPRAQNTTAWEYLLPDALGSVR